MHIAQPFISLFSPEFIKPRMSPYKNQMAKDIGAEHLNTYFSPFQE
jgi:hypothetical protein